MPPLYLQQEFPSLRAFKEALYAWAIEAHFEPRILKSDTCRVRVGCKTDPNCPFIIRCNFDTERKRRDPPVAVITVFKSQHTCENDGSGGASSTSNAVAAASGKGKFINRSTASRLPFLVENVPRLLQVTANTKPIDIREAMLKEYGYELHLQQCRRAKAEILKALEGQPGANGAAPGAQGTDADPMGQLHQSAAMNHSIHSPHLADPMSIQPQGYTQPPGPLAPSQTQMSGSINSHNRQQNHHRSHGQNQAAVHQQARQRPQSQSQVQGHGQGQQHTQIQMSSTLSTQTRSQIPTPIPVAASIPQNHAQAQAQSNPQSRNQTQLFQAQVQAQMRESPRHPQESPAPMPSPYSTSTPLRDRPIDTHVYDTTQSDSGSFTLQSSPLPRDIPPVGAPNPPARNPSISTAITAHASGAVPSTVSTPAIAPEQPIRCPYCVNQRWLKSIKEAVEHMSMHVVL